METTATKQAQVAQILSAFKCEVAASVSTRRDLVVSFWFPAHQSERTDLVDALDGLASDKFQLMWIHRPYNDDFFEAYFTRKPKSVMVAYP